MARVYATTAAYEAWTGETAPANVDRLLRTASRLVDRALHAVVYATDSAGMPSDADVAEAMSDATCAIAQSLQASGALDGATTTSDDEWQSLTVGGVSLTRASGDAAVSSGDQPTVDGVAIPVAALVALRQVGPVRVVVS